jgi:hypothetical protein
MASQHSSRRSINKPISIHAFALVGGGRIAVYG